MPPLCIIWAVTLIALIHAAARLTKPPPFRCPFRCPLVPLCLTRCGRVQVIDRDPARLAAAGKRLDAGLGQWSTRLKSVPTRRPKKAAVSSRRRLKGAKGGGGGGTDRAREGRTHGLQVNETSLRLTV